MTAFNAGVWLANDFRKWFSSKHNEVPCYFYLIRTVIYMLAGCLGNLQKLPKISAKICSRDRLWWMMGEWGRGWDVYPYEALSLLLEGTTSRRCPVIADFLSLDYPCFGKHVVAKEDLV